MNPVWFILDCVRLSVWFAGGS